MNNNTAAGMTDKPVPGARDMTEVVGAPVGRAATRPPLARASDAGKVPVAPSSQPSTADLTRQTADKLASFRDAARTAREKATADNAAAARLNKELTETRAILAEREQALESAQGKIDELEIQLEGRSSALAAAQGKLNENSRTIEALTLEVRALKGALGGNLEIFEELFGEVLAIANLPDPTAVDTQQVDGQGPSRFGDDLPRS